MSPKLILAKLGILNRGKTKEALVSLFLKGWSKPQLEALAQRYINLAKKESLFKKKALKQLKNDLNEGDVYIVSASLDFWLVPIAKKLGVHLICTEIAYKDLEFTGKFSTPNCNYDEKPKRVITQLDLSYYKRIVYYGDSRGDLKMKPLVTTFHLNYFK
jgi:HAD superfamily phosphoserine phosphatase-like hydrolase